MSYNVFELGHGLDIGICFPFVNCVRVFSRWGQELEILMSIEQMTDISRLTEADKICISVVDLPMILIEALETFMNRILDFRELG